MRVVLKKIIMHGVSLFERVEKFCYIKRSFRLKKYAYCHAAYLFSENKKDDI